MLESHHGLLQTEPRRQRSKKRLRRKPMLDIWPREKLILSPEKLTLIELRLLLRRLLVFQSQS
jgi:hypothetical protein